MYYEIAAWAAFLGTIMALVSTTLALTKVIQKKRAEDRLVEEIRRNKVEIAEAMWELCEEESDVERARDSLLSIVRKYVMTLDRVDQERLTGAFNQPSSRGREEYVKKLMNEAGAQIPTSTVRRATPALNN